jgi:hypothetical protein
MSPVNQQSCRWCPPFQWLAAVLPLLVIALGLLAVRPDWHEAMHVQGTDGTHHDHGHDHGESTDERGCAIELFASGLVDSVAFSSPVPAPVQAIIAELTLPDERLLFASSRLEPPGRAPPFFA